MSISISIIIPVYNMEKYLKDCLNSVFKQTYNNFEVIIVNDGSTDDSDKVIQSYIKKHNNITYIIQKNQGLSVSRNNAIKYVKGEYTLFLDSDDYLENNCLEELYKKAKANDADIVIMGHRKLYFEIKHKRYEDIIPNADEDIIYTGKDVAQMMLNWEVLGYSCDKFFKSDNIKNNKLYFEPNKNIEDLYPIFKQVYNSEKIMFVNAPLYNYRQRGESISNFRNQKLLHDYIEANKCVLNYVENNKFNFSKDIIFKFSTIFFNTMITIYDGCRRNKSNMYSDFYKLEYGEHEPGFIELMMAKNLKMSIKLSITLWKLRIYHILMPSLRKVKDYIKSYKNKGGYLINEDGV